MAFPFTVNPLAPAGSDSPALGDNELRSLKQALIDLFGLPSSPTNITAAIMGVNADGTIATPGLVRLGTITAQKAILDGTGTWNDAADTFTAILASITDTASAAASKLIDLKVGGVSKFSVDKTGKILTGLGVNVAPPAAGVIQSSGAMIAGGGYGQPGTGGETLRFLRGTINQDGTIKKGSGFTSSRTSAGQYVITPSTAFSDHPSATANPQVFTRCADVNVQGPSQVNINVFTPPNTLVDSEFTFIIAGPN